MYGILLLLWACICAGCGTSGRQQPDTSKDIVLAYVTSNGKTLPDPSLVTHINYAFGHVDSTFSKVVIDRESRLQEIANLKKDAPHLKVLLSIGGWAVVVSAKWQPTSNAVCRLPATAAE